MTAEEAIAHCKGYLPETDIRKYVIEALEKQTPQRALNIDKGEVFSIGYCPRCKEGLNSEFKYCLECGQAIDWGKE